MAIAVIVLLIILIVIITLRIIVMSIIILIFRFFAKIRYFEYTLVTFVPKPVANHTPGALPLASLTSYLF